MSKITILTIVAVLATIITVGTVKAIDLGSITEAVNNLKADVGNFLSEEPLGADLEVADTSWDNIVAKSIDTGVGTSNVTKEVISEVTVEEVTTEAYSKVSFTYGGETLTADTDFVGYNSCLAGTWGTSTVAFCKEFHLNQINGNAKTARESKDGRDAQEALGAEALETKDL